MRKRLIVWLLLNALLVDFVVAAPGESVTLGGAKYVASPSDKHFETALDEIIDFIKANYAVADIIKSGERVYTSDWKKYRGLQASVIIRNDDMDIKIWLYVEQRLPYFLPPKKVSSFFGGKKAISQQSDSQQAHTRSFKRKSRCNNRVSERNSKLKFAAASSTRTLNFLAFLYRKTDGDLCVGIDYLSYPYDYGRHEYDEYETHCIGIEKNINGYMRKKGWTCESRDFIFDRYFE